MNTIITPDEAKTLGRPIGKVSDAKINAYIFEIEQTIIRRRLGDELYLSLVEYVRNKREEAPTDPVEPDEPTEETEQIEPNSETEDDDKFDILLNGGVYHDKNEKLCWLTGLKIAESYYVYAQYVRAGDLESTRFGLVKKDDDYSQPISSKERDMAANSATEIADVYLQEVIAYCTESDIIKIEDSRASLHTTSGCVIRKIRS